MVRSTRCGSSRRTSVPSPIAALRASSTSTASTTPARSVTASGAGSVLLMVPRVPRRRSAAGSAGELPFQVPLFRNVRRVPGGGPVLPGRRRGVPGHLVQVAADRVEPVVLGEGVRELVGGGEPGRRAVHHGDR